MDGQLFRARGDPTTPVSNCPTQARPARVPDARALLAAWAALAVDIETHPGEDDRIFKLGMARSDRADHLNLAIAKPPAASVTAQVDALTTGFEHPAALGQLRLEVSYVLAAAGRLRAMRTPVWKG